jgi:hypothetical protein
MNIKIEQYDDIYTVRSYGSYAVLTSVRTVGSADIEVVDDPVQDASLFLNKEGMIVIGSVAGSVVDTNYLIVKRV